MTTSKSGVVTVPYKLSWGRNPGFPGTVVPGNGEAGHTVAQFATIEEAATFACQLGSACLMPNQHPAVRAAVAAWESDVRIPWAVTK